MILAWSDGMEPAGLIARVLLPDNIIALSMMRSRKFAKDYGVLIENGPLAGITARALVVIDENDKVIHSELVPEIEQEPNYDAALATL